MPMTPESFDMLPAEPESGREWDKRKMMISIADLKFPVGLVLEPPSPELLCFAATLQLEGSGDFPAQARRDLQEDQGTAIMCMVIQPTRDRASSEELCIAEVELRFFLALDATQMRSRQGVVHCVTRTFPVALSAVTNDTERTQ